MLYQFMDWRLGGRGRRMYVVQVEKLFERLRTLDKGRLPLYLGQWEEYQAFAGEAGIMLPDMYAAAKSVFLHNDSYPTLSWLEAEYAKLLRNVADSSPEMLKDPPPQAKMWSTLDGGPIQTPPITAPESFEETVEGSISNVMPKEGDELCLAQSQVTSSPTSISTGLQNTLLTEPKLLPPIPHNSTPTPAL